MGLRRSARLVHLICPSDESRMTLSLSWERRDLMIMTGPTGPNTPAIHRITTKVLCGRAVSRQGR